MISFILTSLGEELLFLNVKFSFFSSLFGLKACGLLETLGLREDKILDGLSLDLVGLIEIDLAHGDIP